MKIETDLLHECEREVAAEQAAARKRMRRLWLRNWWRWTDRGGIAKRTLAWLLMISGLLLFVLGFSEFDSGNLLGAVLWAPGVLLISLAARLGAKL